MNYRVSYRAPRGIEKRGGQARLDRYPSITPGGARETGPPATTEGQDRTRPGRDQGQATRRRLGPCIGRLMRSFEPAILV